MIATHRETALPQSWGTASPYRHMMIALDGSERAERILPHVVMLARQFGAAITLLRVSTPPGPLVPEVPEGALWGATAGAMPASCGDRERGETAQYLWTLADQLRAAGLTVDWVEAEGAPADTIVERARSLGADLIAMTTHSRGLLARQVLGSVADEVMRRADCPVWLLRAP
jgi:nucleotide-binding universal stress UspA family protein